MPPLWSSQHGWWTNIISSDGNVAVSCNVPRAEDVSQALWNAALQNVLERLTSFNRLGVEGHLAVSSVLKDLPDFIREHSGVGRIAYAHGDTVYTWPATDEALRLAWESADVSPGLPFYRHEWTEIPLYHGNYAPVSNVRFGIEDAVVVSRSKEKDTWLVLLEAHVGQLGNDAILQKFAFVEAFQDGRYAAHEDDDILENAGGGGPYDLIMEGLIVTARGDVIARLPNHYELGNVLLSIDAGAFRAQRRTTFRSPSPELIPVGSDIDRELMKYLHRFPEHVDYLPGDSFEKIVAEVLASQGFSDIQLNIRNCFGEIDIIAFERSDSGRQHGYIVECKRYKRGHKVTLREAHVLAMKRILMQSQGIDRAMLVTTSDFTGPTRALYDSAWGMQLKAYDQVIEWLRSYKVNRDGLYSEL